MFVFFVLVLLVVPNSFSVDEKENYAYIEFYEPSLTCEGPIDALTVVLIDECITIGQTSAMMKTLNDSAVSQRSYAFDSTCGKNSSSLDYTLDECNCPMGQINSAIPALKGWDDSWNAVVEFSKSSCPEGLSSFVNLVYPTDCLAGDDPVVIIIFCEDDLYCEKMERKCDKGVQSVLHCGEIKL